MSDDKRYVFRESDVPIFENPSKTMQDTVMVTEDTCGSMQNTAGLFWLAPYQMGGDGESHSGIDELFYVISGRGIFFLQGEPLRIQAGDVCFVPKDFHHRVENDGEDVLKLFWVTHERWSKLPEIRNMFADWPVIDADSVWA